MKATPGCHPCRTLCWGPASTTLTNGNTVDIDYENQIIKVTLEINEENQDFYESIVQNNTIYFDEDLPNYKSIVQGSCDIDSYAKIPMGNYELSSLSSEKLEFEAPLEFIEL